MEMGKTCNFIRQNIFYSLAGVPSCQKMFLLYLFIDFMYRLCLKI